MHIFVLLVAIPWGYFVAQQNLASCWDLKTCEEGLHFNRLGFVGGATTSTHFQYSYPMTRGTHKMLRVRNHHVFTFASKARLIPKYVTSKVRIVPESPWLVLFDSGVLQSLGFARNCGHPYVTVMDAHDNFVGWKYHVRCRRAASS